MTIQKTDPRTGLNNKQAQALAELTARAVGGIFYSRDIRELSITDGTLKALRERGYIRQVLPSKENGFRCYYMLPGVAGAPQKERWWSDGIQRNDGERVDVYVDGADIYIGVRDGSQVASIKLRTADVLKLTEMLQDAAAHAEAWRLP